VVNRSLRAGSLHRLSVIVTCVTILGKRQSSRRFLHAAEPTRRGANRPILASPTGEKPVFTRRSALTQVRGPHTVSKVLSRCRRRGRSRREIPAIRHRRTVEEEGHGSVGEQRVGIAGRNAQALALVLASVLLLAAPVSPAPATATAVAASRSRSDAGVNIVLGRSR
jgi:hypothetical protein